MTSRRGYLFLLLVAQAVRLRRKSNPKSLTRLAINRPDELVNPSAEMPVGFFAVRRRFGDENNVWLSPRLAQFDVVGKPVQQHSRGP
jgi:hypothetical protein